ncbi:MAG TPA: DapH/DapD/GlmU-related protein [Solirubrobacteraceae bacterium]|nr:DapH/DapD/GlmU-related protein [Solirubrobacteraceae bacterium]
MIRTVIEAVIQRVREDPSYRVDEKISMRDILVEVEARSVALVRAQWKLLGVRGGRWRFVESRCSIRHRRHLTVGSGSVLEHGARLSCLSRRGIKIGNRVTIGKYSLIECTSVLWHLGEGLAIGDGSSIGDYSFIGCAGGVVIGSNVLMGQRVSFHSQNHNFEDITRPIREQGVTDSQIVVGDDCWLGSGSIILSGVELGPGSVVAAGSVVNRSFGPKSVVAGVPARLVRLRDGTDNGTEDVAV